ncbi:hypothetical protein BD779DRAFT_1754040 [Infundibulicybe gibba]|nr:hypothetical protein BD779DRAFT_1754040 [Infundibulicybe gibba]
MHAVTHSLAHRAPPATRTRVYLNTPTLIVSPLPPSATPLCELERLRQALPPSAPTKDSQIREPPKNKHATGLLDLLTNGRLLDQAVKSLCEIWQPQDIPSVFLTSSRAMVTVPSNDSIQPNRSLIHKSRNRNVQLPSPVSPSTQPSPSASPSSTSSRPVCQATETAGAICSKSNLVPLRGFVHEVLRRSRTSGSVLQTALCYLEAIRPKVPELVRIQKSGHGVQMEPDLNSRICPATEAELEREAQLNGVCHGSIADENLADDNVATVRILDHLSNDMIGSNLQEESTESKKTKSLPPLPPLPSPLLCPRRAFLASLILASKFTQDKCYSNRAWAKLSGLPPREIGRCERALGDALEWRLWVGKTPVAPQTPTSTPPQANRSVSRSQSEGCLNNPVTDRSPFFTHETNVSVPPTPAHLTQGPKCCGLRRCNTLPTEIHESQPIHRNDQTTMWHTSSSSRNTAQRDQAMSSPNQSWNFLHLGVQSETLGAPTSDAMVAHMARITQSPSPNTPGLTYSPSSTESSSGDRTIQMSSFLDDTIVQPNPTYGMMTTDTWPWTENCDGNLTRTGFPPPLPVKAPPNTNAYPSISVYPQPGLEWHQIKHPLLGTWRAELSAQFIGNMQQ